MRTLANRLGNTEGAEIAEAALVLPVVFLFLLGIVWFGRAFNIYSTITQAAEQGAIVAARPTCATCGNNQAAIGASTSAVEAVMDASSLDTSQIIAKAPSTPVFCPSPPYPAGLCTTAGDKVTVCSNMLLNTASQPPVCGALVSFQYPFQFYLPFTSLNLSQIILTAQAQSRMEN
jgi:TadE-like protein